MHNLRITLASGLLILCVALVLTLSQAPISVSRANTTFERNLGYTGSALQACQAGELLPAGTTAIRLKLAAFTGPAINVTASVGEHVIASGERGAGWTGGVVTVPLRKVPSSSAHVKLCFGWTLKGSESVALYGERAATGSRDRLAVEYMRPGTQSWFSLALPVARRMGLGRAPSGTWIVLLAAGLMAAVVGLCSLLSLRELG